MRRRSDVEELIDIFSLLPWWVCLILAFFSYLIMHHYAIHPGEPVDTTGVHIGTMGSYTVKQMYRTFAYFGQMILPFIFGIAGLASVIRKTKNNRRS